MKKVYISGPMSGIPEFNYPAFFEAEERFRKEGWDVSNPARMSQANPGHEWEWYIRCDISALSLCTHIALLPGWGRSRGARLELLLAQQLKMEVLDAVTMKSITDTVPEGKIHF